MVASVGLDVERSTLYFDLVEASLSEAARKALRSMDPAKYEYQSEFARHYFAQGRAEGEAEGEAKGRAEGKAEGKAEVVAKQLSLRFGTLPDSAQQRLRNASIAELDRIAERLLTAASLGEALE
jgi:flagellar biosynthesis/type III secretory pathway protein FliH